MMAIEECIHSDALTPETCALCLATDKEPEPTVTRHKVGPEFAARHESQCPGCNLPIVQGQALQKWSDGKYRHGGNRPCTP